MSNDNEDRNYISVGSWMLMMLITAIPCIGLVMIFVWAFAGDNDSRKNYFRAILAWFAIFVVLVLIVAALGQLPELRKHLEGLTHKK